MRIKNEYGRGGRYGKPQKNPGSDEPGVGPYEVNPLCMEPWGTVGAAVQSGGDACGRGRIETAKGRNGG